MAMMALKIDERDVTINRQAKQLVFVAMEGREGCRVAIEANLGLTGFGADKTDLIADIKDKVRQYFKADFKGQIRLREFTDTVIDV